MKTGDTRADGFVYVGKNRGYDHYLSPEAYARKQKRRTEVYNRFYAKRKANPLRLALANAYQAKARAKERVNNPEKTMWVAAKHRAKIKNIPFDIHVNDIKIPKICPVLGIPLIAQKGKPSDNSPELDRIVNEKGYVKENVLVVSRKVNRLKSNANIKDLFDIVAFYTLLV